MPHSIIFKKERKISFRRVIKVRSSLYRAQPRNGMLSHNAGVVPVCYTWIGLALHHPLLFPVLTSTRKPTLSPSNGFKRKIKGICLGHAWNGDRTMTQVLKNCKFPKSEPTIYPAGDRYSQHRSPGFTGGMAAHHLRLLQQKERDGARQTAASLLPVLPICPEH